MLRQLADKYQQRQVRAGSFTHQGNSRVAFPMHTLRPCHVGCGFEVAQFANP